MSEFPEHVLEIMAPHIAKNRDKKSKELEEILLKILLSLPNIQAEPEIQLLRKMIEECLSQYDKLVIRKDDLKEEKKYLAKVEEIAGERGISLPSTEEIIERIKEQGRINNFPPHIITSAIKGAKRDAKKAERKERKKT